MVIPETIDTDSCQTWCCWDCTFIC